MQAVLGPSVIEHGVNPDTAMVGFDGGMGMLGPARGPTDEVDPVARLFVLLGKLVHCRRILEPGQPGVDRRLNQFGALQTVVLGYDRDAVFDVVWKPLANSIRQDAVESINRAVDDLDQRTRRFVASETHTLLGFDPAASVEQRMASLDLYLRMKGYTLEANSDGFRNFIAGSFVGPDGKRISMPTSDKPTFPDAWITPERVESGPTRREWNIIF